jgi:secreted PhoX family phosphatase
MASLIASTTARSQSLLERREGYGPLIPDRNGVLDLPRGFHYRVFSREGDAMITGGIVPGSHDGMSAFPAGLGQTWLDGRTLFVNIQGPPGLTFAIWGPW